MRFTTLLNNGVKAKSVAKRVATELQQREEADGYISLEFVADFINECFAAIGFRSTISPEELDAEATYHWPDELRIYTFNYNSLTFTPFEKCLVHLCEAVREQQEEFAAERQSRRLAVNNENEGSTDDIECPVQRLMILLAYWCRICKHLQNEERRESLQRFKEPLARIDFHLLLGMHDLRKAYRTELPLLDNICNWLYHSALHGIFYKETHTTIATGLLLLFEHDFDLFYEHRADTLKLYYSLLEVEQQKSTHFLVFKRLQTMLESHACRPRKLLILTNFLIQPFMQEVYYTTLKLEKYKRILVAILKFLKLLQSKLLSLDSFSQDFIESILAQVLNTDTNISSLAAELYIVMMRRKLSDDLVLKHILEFYLHKLGSPKSINKYVRNLRPHFPRIDVIDIHLEVIQNSDTNVIMRHLISFVVLAVYEHMFENFVEYLTQIKHVLETLPQVLENLTCHTSIGILLQVYRATDLDLLKDSCSAYKQILKPFERYASRMFIRSTNMQFPLLMNIFASLNHSLRYTNSLNMQECMNDVYEEHDRIEKLLQDVDETQVSPKSALLRAYRNVLCKLSIIHMMGHGKADNNEELFIVIKARLIDSQKIQSYVAITNSYIDVYAIEVLTNCLKKIANGVCDVNQGKMFASYAQQLLLYLLSAQRKMNNTKMKSLVHIKTIFCCLVTVYCTFHSTSVICFLKLEPQHYNLLVNTLLIINFKACRFDTTVGDEDMQVHPKRTLEYQRFMLRQFTLLHATKNVNIPSNVSWKLCVYYGLPSHKFNDELAALLQTIAQCHAQVYKHIASVIVYNLHRQQPRLADATVLRAIKAHRNLIDTQLPLQSREVFKVHIVLVVLQIIEKTLNVQQINVSANRLEALRHLHLFVDNLNVSSANVLPDILNQADLLKQHLLTANEQSSLSAFLDFFSSTQMECSNVA